MNEYAVSSHTCKLVVYKEALMRRKEDVELIYGNSVRNSAFILSLQYLPSSIDPEIWAGLPDHHPHPP